MADVTESPTQKPSKKQKDKYSGKKKQATLKTEISISEQGKMIGISKTHGGPQHGFALRKADKPFSKRVVKIVDSGYQGLQKNQSLVLLPYKQKAKQALRPVQKAFNRKLASIRIRIEHKIRELKVFQILQEMYHYFEKKYQLRFNILAGIVNSKQAIRTYDSGKTQLHNLFLSLMTIRRSSSDCAIKFILKQYWILL